MSKQKQNITINNHISNGNGEASPKKENSLTRLAAWMTILAGLITAYYFFQDEVSEWFAGPEVEYAVPVGE